MIEGNQNEPKKKTVMKILHVESEGVYNRKQSIETVRVKDETGRRFIMPKARFLVMQRERRLLDENEQVHHRDHNSMNNNLDNLVVMPASEHRQYHSVYRTLTSPSIQMHKEDAIQMANGFLEAKHETDEAEYDDLRKYIKDNNLRIFDSTDMEQLINRCVNYVGRHRGTNKPATVAQLRNADRKRKVPRPSYDELKRLLKEHNGSIKEVAAIFGVAPTVIRQWIYRYETYPYYNN